MKRNFLIFLLILSAVFCAYGQNNSPIDLVLLLDTSQGMSSSYDNVNNYITGPFLSEFLRVGDTFHLVTFSANARLDSARIILGVGDIETIIGRMLIQYPVENGSNVTNALTFAERYVTALPSRAKKIVLITTGGADTNTLVTASKQRLNSRNTTLDYIQVTPGRPLSNLPKSGRPEIKTTAADNKPTTSAGTPSRPSSSQTEVKTDTTSGTGKPSSTDTTGTASSGTVSTQTGSTGTGAVSGTNATGTGAMGTGATGTSQTGTSSTGTSAASGTNTPAETSTTPAADAASGTSSDAATGTTSTEGASSSAETGATGTGQISTDSEASNVSSGSQASKTPSGDKGGTVSDNTRPSDNTSNAANKEKQGNKSFSSSLPFILLIVFIALIIIAFIIYFASRRLGSSPNRVMAEVSSTEDKSRFKDHSKDLASYAAVQSRRTTPYEDRVVKYDKDKQPIINASGPLLLNLVVDDQNTEIGRRNIHSLKSGYNLSVGGGNADDFLIFLVPMPAHIGEIRRNGGSLTFVPQKAKYFPEIGSNEVRDCINKTIKIISDKKYEMRFRFEMYEDPLVSLNRMLMSVKVPG